MKKQVILIHGGEIFESRKDYLSYLKKEKIDFVRFTEPRKEKWKDLLRKRLGSSFQVVFPTMPNANWDDKYPEWKIWFEKLIPHIKNGGIFVGHSLGGIFLAKYLSENVFPKKIKAVFLVAAPFESIKKGRPEYFGGFVLKNDLSLMAKQAKEVYLYQSKDDPLVPFSHFEQFQAKLPTAKSAVFTDRGHFIQKEFPELVKAIKSLS